MKKLFFLLLALHFNFAYSQELPDFDEIPLKKQSDYYKADSFVLIASNYLLSTPYVADNKDRTKSQAFIINWMSGTPDYTFSIGKTALDITKKNPPLLGIYMACMAKYCLENKVDGKDEKVVTLNAVKLLLAYCEDAENNIKMTKELKKLSEANKKGELEKEL